MKRCACLILQNAQGDYLLQMRDDTPGIVTPLQWDSFGGGVEEGEDILQAAARELEEELGVKASPDELTVEKILNVGLSEEHFVRLKRPLEWGDFKVFEGAGAGFFTPEEIAKIPTTPPVKALFAAIREGR
jgi:8-oxo-dGTP pyrophosphatase MutT (NUDIX family)